eukprot:g2451.t1
MLPASRVAKTEDTGERARQRLSRLNDMLLRHDKAYFEDAKPTISDREYDSLAEEARCIEVEYPEFVDERSRSQRVGSGQSIVNQDEIRKHKHLDRVLSLTNSYEVDGALKLLSKVWKIEEERNERDRSETLGLVAEPKIDGISVTLRYGADGNFVHAATRGDGSVGEDVSEAIVRLGSVPEQICETRLLSCMSSDFEIRGEVYMPKLAAARLADRENGGDAFAHSRNVTAGTLRRAQTIPDMAAKRGLEFSAYALTVSRRHGDGASGEVDVFSDARIISQIDLLRHLSDEWGFFVPDPAISCATTDSVRNAISRFQDLRASLHFDIDGIVFKVNELQLQRKMGRSMRAPRWATAYKFPAQGHRTRVLDVRWQVSRFGVLTPVAELEPVLVGGAMVKRATLHNLTEIGRSGVQIGSDVIVERAGEVIPKIVRVVGGGERGNDGDDARPTSPIAPPTECPACGSDVVHEGVTLANSSIRCMAGIRCSAQREARLLHFSGRNGIGIPGFGSRTLNVLCTDVGLVNTPADIFRLREANAARPSEERLERRKGWGRKSVEKIFAAVEQRVADGITLSQLISSLGIPRVGKSAATAMAEASDNDPVRWRYECVRLSRRDSEAVDVPVVGEENTGTFENIGTACLQSLSEYFGDEENVRLFDDITREISKRGEGGSSKDLANRVRKA